MENIFIRVDMNPVIATGHMMRCLSIADAVAALGRKIIFITADEYPSEMIRQRGYDNIVLGTDWKCMETETEQLKTLIKEYKVRKLFVDSYQVTRGYLQSLKMAAEVIYLDDLDAFAYPADKLICYANYFGEFSYGRNTEAEGCYLGMKYVPLRRVFQNCPPKRIRDRIEKVLILSGGSDTYGIIKRMVDIFKDKKEVKLITVCGRFYDGFDKLKEEYADFSNLFFYQNIPDLEMYMKDVDLAISAGGTTLYELCAIGTPTVSYSFADNQLYNVKQFAKDGLIDYAGDVRTDDIFSNALSLFEKYNADKSVREERSALMQKMVDGKGAERIAHILTENENVT